MYSKLLNWKGSVEVNGTEYQNIQDANAEFKTLENDICILLHSSTQNVSKSVQERPIVSFDTDKTLKIEVKSYMLRKSTPTFDFMAKFNNDNPMPMLIMIGTVEKETPGMVYMKLHADIVKDTSYRCMKCGRPINNPVSKFFGMGPECGGHNYIHPFDSDEELKEAIEAYRKKLQTITWEGYIPKSAIVEKEIIEND